MTRSAEHQARRYLRVFPEWMREVRGEEAIGLVLDQLPPDASRLPLRSKVDLLRSGLHARRRGIPPHRVWNAATTMNSRTDRTVPAAWRPWLIAKLRRRSLFWQSAFLRDPVVALPLLLTMLTWEGDADIGLMWLTLGALGVVRAVWFLLFHRRDWRLRLIAANALDDDGRALPPEEVVAGWSTPKARNLRVLWLVGSCTAASLVVGPLAWMGLDDVLASSDPPRPYATSAAAVVVAVVIAISWSLARVRLWSTAPGPGPSTELGPAWFIGASTGLGLVVAVGMVGAMARLDPIVAMAVPLASLGVTLVVAAAEHLQGRHIGSWDLLPSLGPELLVHRVQELPPPPPPDRPAFG